jgi:hypothetical protein
MKVELKTKRYFTCPNGCAHEMAVEHLLGSGSCGVTKEHPTRQAGPWYCDGCGQGWNLTYTVDSVDVEPAKEKKVDQWIILELPPQTVPVVGSGYRRIGGRLLLRRAHVPDELAASRRRSIRRWRRRPARPLEARRHV